MDVGCRNALRSGKGWRPPEVHLAKPAAGSSLAGREGEGVEGKHEGGEEGMRLFLNQREGMMRRKVHNYSKVASNLPRGKLEKERKTHLKLKLYAKNEKRDTVLGTDNFLLKKADIL